MNELLHESKLDTSASAPDYVNEFFFDENNLPSWLAQIKQGNILMRILYYFLVSLRLS